MAEAKAQRESAAEPAAALIARSEMTLRDHFAALALLGMNSYSGYTDGNDQTEKIRAASAYRQADAMLAARGEERLEAVTP